MKNFSQPLDVSLASALILKRDRHIMMSCAKCRIFFAVSPSPVVIRLWIFHMCELWVYIMLLLPDFSLGLWAQWRTAMHLRCWLHAIKHYIDRVEVTLQRRCLQSKPPFAAAALCCYFFRVLLFMRPANWIARVKDNNGEREAKARKVWWIKLSLQCIRQLVLLTAARIYHNIHVHQNREAT